MNWKDRALKAEAKLAQSDTWARDMASDRDRDVQMARREAAKWKIRTRILELAFLNTVAAIAKDVDTK